MAAADVQRLCGEATCSICLEYFKDPVTILECGHSFCRSCLIQCWGELGAEASCPQCRERVQRRTLITNWQLENFVEIAQNLSLHGQKEEGGKGRICEKHQEPLKLFCKEDEVPICVVCDRSKEHKHQVVPLKEAFEEYKKWTESERQKSVEKFRELHQFLEEQEKHLLTQIEEVEKEIARRRDEQLARLSRDLSSLERIIWEMEEMLQQPAIELLQDGRRTLQRYEERERPEKPLTFVPELKGSISEFCDLNLLVEDAMKQFKDALLPREQLKKANVTLDPDTAHPCLILSEDRKSVREGEKDRDLPNNPERFSTRSCVLGREGFTAGSHFWEVTVGSEGWWALGVARESVRRKGGFDLSPERGVWAMGRWGWVYLAFTSPLPSPLFPSGKVKRIRVTLDYEDGRVSFSDADSGAKLYTFSRASFSGETLFPIFRLWRNKTPLSVS